jgi:PTH1 family peptidyl-tRNA hydrolase
VGDIIERIGTKDFNRIRIGIGRPPLKELVSEYVLQSFTPEEKLELPKIFKETTLKIHDWLKKAE